MVRQRYTSVLEQDTRPKTTKSLIIAHLKICVRSIAYFDGFGRLVVSILATGTRVRGFKPSRNRWIFRASEKSSVCLPSEGKSNNMSHVPALRHVKNPSVSCSLQIH
jgi:hypothetical protein